MLGKKRYNSFQPKYFYLAFFMCDKQDVPHLRGVAHLSMISLCLSAFVAKKLSYGTTIAFKISSTIFCDVRFSASAS